MLIRLLDITDTSHGEPHNILRVTQKQSAKEKETAGREDGGRYRIAAMQRDRKKDREGSGLERRHTKRKCMRKR